MTGSFNVSNCTLSISDLSVKEGDPRGNTYPDVIGGGFLITDSNVTLNRVLVSHNRDEGYMGKGGSGICHQGGGALNILGCTIQYNESGPNSKAAGGIYCEAPPSHGGQHGDVQRRGRQGVSSTEGMVLISLLRSPGAYSSTT